MENREHRRKNESEIHQMFDNIASSYDFLNHVLSFGLDLYWRSKAARLLKKRDVNKYLDVATGTGDLMTSVMRRYPEIKSCVGLDASSRMLEICGKKMRNRGLLKQVELVEGDMREIPFSDGCFDAVTIGFGIRNTKETECALREIQRVLSPGGAAIVLEFGMPDNFFIRSIHLAYFRYLLPVVGGIFSGNFRAYRYLNRTVEKFYEAEEFCRLMREAGFLNVGAQKLTFGVVNIYHGIKGK